MAGPLVPVIVGIGAAYKGYKAYKAYKKFKKAEKSLSRSKAKEVCKHCPDPECVKIYAEVEQAMEQIWKRAKELNYDKHNLPATKPAVPHPELGTRSVQGEQHAFRSDQNALKKALDRLQEKKCPAPPKGAYGLLHMPAPSKLNPIKPPQLPF